MRQLVEKVTLDGLGWVWHNRRMLMGLYHHLVKHKVFFDQFVDWGMDHPDHPMNQKKDTDDAAN